MPKQTIFIIYFVAAILSTECYKILGIFPSLDRNNYITYRGLFRELANRNHEVTLISNFPMTDPPASYKDILLSEYKDSQHLSFESVIVSDISRVPFETLVATKAGNDDCKLLMNNNHVLHMIRTRPRYDVILVESYNSDCGLALASNLSAPYITFNPQPLQSWQFNRLGINFNSAYVTQSGLPYGKEPWYLMKLQSYVLYHITNWVYYVGSQVTDHVYLYKYLGDDLPALETLASNASIAFVNTHRSLYGGFARPDNLVDIGGIHIRPPKVIPIEIERFINEAEHGVIYVNLGTTVKDSTLPSDKLNELLSTFAKLPLRVLWKWDGANLQARNVMTMGWLPQYDILTIFSSTVGHYASLKNEGFTLYVPQEDAAARSPGDLLVTPYDTHGKKWGEHDNVKAFISHAGILSTIEAVDAGIPVVAIPLFGDQFGNAAALEDAGMASIVNYDSLKKQYLLDAINEVLDPGCQQRAKLASRLWHDRTMSPLESAIYWTEYVARYQGAPNLQSKAPSLPWYQLLQIDVLAFIGIVLYILAYCLYKILTLLCCCCCPKVEETEYAEERSKRVKFE